MSRTGPAGSSFDRRLLAPMVLASVLNPVNSSIIAVSLIPIGRALDAPPSQTAWLVSGLYVATAIGQPLTGRLVDAWGPRPVYLVGTALVGLAGLLGMVATDLPMLVAVRVLLGIGTCAGYPSAMSLVRSEATRTGKDSPAGVLTVLAVANQTVAVLGPTLGGLLVGLAGWRSTFAVNLPLSLACLWLGARRLPRGRPERAPRTDPLGPAGGRRLPATRSLLGNRPLLATYLRNLLGATVSYSFLYGFTQWLQEGRHLSPTHAGLVLLPMFATAIAVSALTGPRPGVRGKLLVGGAVFVAASVGLLGLSGASPLWVLLALMLLLGLPQGLLNLANQNAVYHQAQPELVGTAAGLLRTSLYGGAIIASTASGQLLGPDAGTAGLHRLAVFLTVVAVLMVLSTLADRSLSSVGRRAPRTEH